MQDAFDWPGTLDPTPWLCVGEAIGFLESLLDGGLPALMRRNHELAVLGRRVLCQRLGLRPIGPEAMLGSMAAFQLPDNESAPQGQKWLDGDNRLHDELLFRRGIEVPTFYWPAAPQRIVRISAQAYNHPAQYQRLAEALHKRRGWTATVENEIHGGSGTPNSTSSAIRRTTSASPVHPIRP